MVHHMKPEIKPLLAPGAVVVVETALFVLEVNKEQKIAYLEKVSRSPSVKVWGGIRKGADGGRGDASMHDLKTPTRLPQVQGLASELGLE